MEEDTLVLPDQVHVIAPDHDLTLRRGVLQPARPQLPSGWRLPIDSFLRGLADACQAEAVGVVLSGIGSDGTAGLLAIRQQRGLTLVQDPASAESDSMPNSAIQAGAADIVAPPEALPGRLMDALRRLAPAGGTGPAEQPADSAAPGAGHSGASR